MTINDNPIECGLENFCKKGIDWSTGKVKSFIGDKALKKVMEEGPKKIIRSIEMEGKPIPLCVEPWPVHFKNKKVGQIGTGSTGIQAVPVIASEAKHLTVFQRTANYSIPARNAPLSREFKDHVKKDYESYRKFLKKTPNGHPFEISTRLVSDVDTKERNDIYEKAWEKGGLQFRATFNDLVTNIEANKTASEFIKEKSIEYPVSFNGKLRFKINLEASVEIEQIKKIVLNHEKTSKYLEGKEIKKVIIVPKKIINIVC